MFVFLFIIPAKNNLKQREMMRKDNDEEQR